MFKKLQAKSNSKTSSKKVVRKVKKVKAPKQVKWSAASKVEKRVIEVTIDFCGTTLPSKHYTRLVVRIDTKTNILLYLVTTDNGKKVVERTQDYRDGMRAFKATCKAAEQLAKKEKAERAAKAKAKK